MKLTNKTFILTISLLAVLGCTKSKENKTTSIPSPVESRPTNPETNTTTKSTSQTATASSAVVVKQGNDSVDILDGEFDDASDTDQTSSTILKRKKVESKHSLYPKRKLSAKENSVSETDTDTDIDNEVQHESESGFISYEEQLKKDKLELEGKPVVVPPQTSPEMSSSANSKTKEMLKHVDTSPRFDTEPCFDLTDIIFSNNKLKSTGGMKDRHYFLTIGDDYLIDFLRTKKSKLDSFQIAKNTEL